MAHVSTRGKLYLVDIAAMRGVAVKTITGIRARGGMPAPDGTDIDQGHARPWWRPATVRTWLAGLPGKGWRAGQTG